MSKTSHEWLIEAIASSEGERSAAIWLAVNLAEKEQEIERLNKIVKAFEQTYEEESKAEFKEVEIGRRFIEIVTKHMSATCDESKKEAPEPEAHDRLVWHNESEAEGLDEGLSIPLHSLH